MSDSSFPKSYAEESMDEVVIFEDEFEEDPVFKGFEGDETTGFVEESVGFEEEDIERGFDDGELALMMPPMMTRGDALGDFIPESVVPEFDATPMPKVSAIEALMTSSGLEDLKAPALKPAPFFLDSTHIVTTASAGLIIVSLASMFLKSDMAPEYSEGKAKFKIVHYEGAEFVEFRVYVHSRTNVGDHAVEFCRRAGSRTLFSKIYKQVVSELAVTGVVAQSAVPRAPSNIAAPLPVPDLVDDDELASSSVGPSSEPSEAQKIADRIMTAPEDVLVDNSTLSKACKLMSSMELFDDIAPLASKAVVGRLLSLAGSHNPGVSRAALEVLVDISGLVSSELGPDELSVSFGPNSKTLASSLNSVFRHSDGLGNFMYSPAFSKALSLICTLAVDDEMSKLLIDNGIGKLVSRLRESRAHSKPLHEQANVAFMSLCVA